MRVRGFTLVELLVVLVLVSLISVLLTRSLVFVVDLRGRILSSVEYARANALREQWFRRAVRATVADLEASERAFEGTADSIKAVTLEPIDQPYGVATQVRWTLSGDGEQQVLLYQSQGGVQFRLLRWHGLGHFSYLDHAGNWHERWPVPMQDVPQLPAAIRFDWIDDGEPKVWFVAVATSPDARPGLRLPAGLF